MIESGPIPVMRSKRRAKATRYARDAEKCPCASCLRYFPERAEIRERNKKVVQARFKSVTKGESE